MTRLEKMPRFAESDATERPAESIGNGDRSMLARFLESPWVTWGVPLIIFVTSLAIHAAAASRVDGLDSSWFALTGIAFLVITAASHAVLCRSRGSDLVVGILGSMAIRLAGTFAILGLLLFFSPLGRRGAVCNVLFWYITLTLWDLFSVAYRRMSSPTIGLSSFDPTDSTPGSA